MESLKKIQQFFSYWYIRYLLATEMYMVETWEKIVVHVFLLVLFSLFWWFNYSIVISSIEHLRGASSHVQEVL